MNLVKVERICLFPVQRWALILLCSALLGVYPTLGQQAPSNTPYIVGRVIEVINSVLDTVWRRPTAQFHMQNNAIKPSFGGLDQQGTFNQVYRAQRAMPNDMPFMCKDSLGTARSPSPPTTVHALRPGDIDIVAAMGDSLTSANGAMAYDVARLVLNNRGLSWVIGGQGTWREYLTIPNILKEFNPALIGYSTGDGYSYSRAAGFNVAVTGAISMDLPHQAKVLVSRMRKDPRVNMREHWKLISILVGSNDICIFGCYNTTGYSGEAHGSHLQKALDYIYKYVPRVFVNLVLQAELSALRSMPGKSLLCQLAHPIECPCMFGAYAETKAVLADKLVEDYRTAEKMLLDSGRYDGRADFTVVLQTFTEQALTGEMKKESSMEMDLFAIDCFHLSQKGNAYAANALWNNMLEPVGNKSKTWRPEFEHVSCPTEAAPYIFTGKNSEAFLRIGRQESGTSSNKTSNDVV